MTQIHLERRIHAPKERVWEVLANFSGVSLYNPSVPNSYTLNAQHTGLGAERRCEFDAEGSKFIDERIIGWQEGQSYDVEIFDGNQIPPVKNLVATLAVQELGNDSIVSFTFSYTPKFGPIGILMNIFMLQRLMTRVGNGILAGLDHYVTTGETVSSFSILKAARSTA